ncbi:MAG: ABC transporter substrate-binding protein [Oscillospiraceae bacterium]
MKKFLAVLLCLVMVAGFAACGTKPAVTTDPPATEEPVAAGSVYYLNFKPEADAAWQELATAYTAETQIPVKVVTAASGTYNETLTVEMDKSEMPTLFQVGNKQALDTWGEYCLDLGDSPLYGEMTDTSFTLKDADDVVRGIAYVYESFGIIVNTALLEKAGYKLADITNFETLKTIVEDITARKTELGFSAFTSAGLDGSSSWRFSGHLTNMPLFYECRDDAVVEQPATIKGTYLENYKNIWDLYINNGTCAASDLTAKTGDESEAEFGKGEAVFYQNGSWEYANLTDPAKFAMDPATLAMIPIYCGVEGEEKAGLCNGTENFWAVNSKAAPEDIQATLDFLYWVVTSETGTTALADTMGFVSPFKMAKAPANVFLAQANEYAAAGNYSVTWAFNFTPNVDEWRAGVVAALTQYSAGGAWDDVVTAFVGGWETQFKNQ